MEPKMIHAAMAKCMADIGSVSKRQTNEGLGYAYRALADVYLACQPVMAANGVHFAPFAIHDYKCDKFDRGNGKFSFHVTMLVEHRFYASDGSYIPVTTIGESIDTSDKASNKAMSASAKYALVQAYCLPEEDPDADADHSHPEIDAFEPLWTALEAIGLKEPTAVKAWCEGKLARALPNAESLTLADLPKLMACVGVDKSLGPDNRISTDIVRHRASKEEALRLMAALDAMGVTKADPAKTKKENSDAAKSACLAWVNGMRAGKPMVGGLLELYADEIIPLIASAKAKVQPEQDELPPWADDVPQHDDAGGK
jgi:hypothetical protein